MDVVQNRVRFGYRRPGTAHFRAASQGLLVVCSLWFALGCQAASQSLGMGQLAQPGSVYEQGMKALQGKDGKAAIAAFSSCVSAAPENVECHWELGWSYYLEHEFDKARAEWLTVRRQAPHRAGLDKALTAINRQRDILDGALALRAASPATLTRKKSSNNGTLSVRAVGDTMLGTDFPSRMLPPEGASPLTNVKPLLQDGDITIANYEGTLCDNGHSQKCEGAKGACFAFRSPTKFAGLLKEVGIDLVSLANNHIFDFGEQCRNQTEHALRGVGIQWSGRPGTVARIERNGVGVSFIAFHAATHTNSTLDIDTASALVAAEKNRGQLVIVSFHGGAEGLSALDTPAATEYYLGENRGDVRRFAHAVVDAGADLVLGSGPHVVRGMELYRDRLVAYSLGNFATYKAFNLWGFNAVGLVLEAELDRDGRFVAGRILPTRQRGFGVPVPDERMTAVDVIRWLSRQDFPAGGVVIAQDGTIGKK